jgi:hypothetical protein
MHGCRVEPVSVRKIWVKEVLPGDALEFVEREPLTCDCIVTATRGHTHTKLCATHVTETFGTADNIDWLET